MSNGQQGFLPSLKLGPREAPKQQTARAAVGTKEPGVRLSLPATPQSARIQKPVERPTETRAEEAADDLDAGHFNISTSTVASCPALQITAQEWGSSAAWLMQADIIRNHRLKSQLSQLRLSDFFDCHGGPHFKRLSISFAAKQNAQVGSTFGSTSNLHEYAELSDVQGTSHSSDEREKGESKALLEDSHSQGDLKELSGLSDLGSSKAFLAASEARARDLLITQQKAELLLLQVRDEERLRTAEVDERRLGLLFSEIPNFESLLPKSVEVKSLVPVDLLEEQEQAEKQSIERQNGFLADNHFIEGSQMCWLFTHAEVLVLSRCLSRWCVSTRGPSFAMGMGMDRPTFCRLLLEVELVDQVAVPYFWAVSLFDSLAQPCRICPPQAHHAPTAPVQSIVNRFRLISLLDIIARQHYEAIDRYEFVDRMKQGAKKLRIYDDAYVAGMTKTNHEYKAEQRDERSKEKSHERRESVDASHGEPGKHIHRNSKAQGSERRESTDEHEKAEKEKGKNQPHVKVWKSMVERDLACRERLVTSMLVEPEVLHVVHFYRDVFSTLFECYAPSGQMQWMDFWQFCVDFHISPQLVTEQQLRRAYETTECFTLLPPRPILPEVPKTKRRAAESTPSKSRAGARREKPNSSASPTPSQPKLKQLSASPDPVSHAHSGKDEDKFKGTDSTISSALTEDSEALECDTAFEVPAFTETLCRIVFLYLGFYGNGVQQSSSSLYKISWLVAYLRLVSTQMHEGLDDFGPAETEPGSPEPRGAEAVVKKLPLSRWEEPPRQKLTGQTMLQPHAGPGNKKVVRRRGKQQPMAPKMLPGRITREAAMNVNRQKTRSSVREAVRQLGKASVVVRAIHDVTNVTVKKMDSSSDEDLPTGPTAASRGSTPKAPVAPGGPAAAASARSRVDPDALTSHVASSFKPMAREPPNQALPVEDLLKAEAGKFAVENGRCQLCERSGDRDLSWSNPGCRGCSVVDALKLEDHLFARLMLPDRSASNVKIRRPKAKPLVGSRLRPTFVSGPEPSEPFAFHFVSQSLPLR